MNLRQYDVVVKNRGVMDKLESDGHEVIRYKMLPLHCVVICEYLNTEDYDLISFDECINPMPAPSTQEAYIPSNFIGASSWALPRICRRRSPWDVNHIVHPITTNYEYSLDGSGVDVYVLDSGTDLSHPELQSTTAENVYEYFSSSGAGDDNGHGTLVAAAIVGSSLGCAKGANLYSFKSASHVGNTNTSIIATIDEVLGHYSSRSALNRPAVCSLSINPTHNSAVADAIGEMIDVGIVCLISLGNAKDNSAFSAVAGTPDIIGVGGHGISDLPYWTNSDGTMFGAEVDILAPAQSLLVAAAEVRAKGDYEVRRGTSIACPYAAGVVACMLEGHPRMTTRAEVQAVRYYLLSQATTGRRRLAFGYTDLPDKILYLDPSITFHNIFI